MNEAKPRYQQLKDHIIERIAAGDAEGFFRPYAEDRGGVAPERWHLSYRLLADECCQRLSPELLGVELRGSGLLLEDTVFAMMREIFERYIA